MRVLRLRPDKATRHTFLLSLPLPLRALRPSITCGRPLSGCPSMSMRRNINFRVLRSCESSRRGGRDCLESGSDVTGDRPRERLAQRREQRQTDSTRAASAVSDAAASPQRFRSTQRSFARAAIRIRNNEMKLPLSLYLAPIRRCDLRNGGLYHAPKFPDLHFLR